MILDICKRKGGFSVNNDFPHMTSEDLMDYFLCDFCNFSHYEKEYYGHSSKGSLE